MIFGLVCVRTVHRVNYFLLPMVPLIHLLCKTCQLNVKNLEFSMGFQFALAAIIPTIMCLHSCFDWLAFARYPKWTPHSLSRFCFFLSHFFPLRLCLLSIRFVGNVGIVHVLRARKSIWNGRLWLKANWRLFSAIYYGEPNMIVLAALCVWVSSRCSTLRVQHILNRWWNRQRSLSHTVVALARHDRSIISMCLKCVSIGSFLFISSPIYISRYWQMQLMFSFLLHV